MASESLLTGTVVTDLTNNNQLKLLDTFLTDTITASLLTSNLPNNSVVKVASGSNADINVVVTPPTATTTGNLSEGGGQTLNFQLPANVGIVAKSKTSNDATATVNYVKSVVDKYIPDATTSTTALAQKNALIAALTKAMVLTQGGASINVSVRVIDFLATTQITDDDDGPFDELLDDNTLNQGIDSLVGANDLLLDAGSSSGSQLFVLNLSALNNKTVVLQNLEAATLASGGRVRVEGSAPIRITSDNAGQNITGGGGADTLVGTGNDTLTGGAGNDVFGFSGNGHYTITDFNKAGDSLAFDVAGVTNLDQMKAKVTGVVQNTNSITYQFGPDMSITLVGVSASDLTASMLKFTIS